MNKQVYRILEIYIYIASNYYNTYLKEPYWNCCVYNKVNIVFTNFIKAKCDWQLSIPKWNMHLFKQEMLYYNHGSYIFSTYDFYYFSYNSHLHELNNS